MEQLIPATYNTPLVVLSYVLAVAGSYIALTATQRMQSQTGLAYRYSIIMAGVALGGIGVWSMHFVGMLAMRVPLGMSYSVWETVISLLAAIVTAALGLTIVARNPKSLLRLICAGATLGAGVSIMHYLGMYGIRFGGFFSWDAQLVTFSIVIAFIAASAALWLAFNTRTANARLVAALVMGVAVCAMHYTGMLAADIICTTSTPLAIPTGSGLVSTLDLPLLVITFIVGMTIAVGVNLMFAPRSSKKATLASVQQ